MFFLRFSGLDDVASRELVMASIRTGLPLTPHSSGGLYHVVSTWWVWNTAVPRTGESPVKFGWYFVQQWSLKLLWQPCPAPASEWRPSSFMCLQDFLGSAPSAFPASSLTGPHLALRVLVIWEDFMSPLSIVSLGSNPQVSHIFSFLGALGVQILVIFSPCP